MLEARVYHSAGVGTRLGLFRELPGETVPRVLGERVLTMLREAARLADAPNVGGRPVDPVSAAVLAKWGELSRMNQPSRALRRFRIAEVIERPGQVSWRVVQILPSRYLGCTTEGTVRRVKHSVGAEGLGLALLSEGMDPSPEIEARLK